MGVYYSDHFECWRSRLRLLWGSQKIIYDFNISKKSSSQFVLLLNFNFASLSTSERRQHSCSTQMHRNISIPQVSNLKFQSSQTMSVQMHFLCFCFNSNTHFPILLNNANIYQRLYFASCSWNTYVGTFTTLTYGFSGLVRWLAWLFPYASPSDVFPASFTIPYECWNCCEKWTSFLIEWWRLGEFISALLPPRIVTMQASQGFLRGNLWDFL